MKPFNRFVYPYLIFAIVLMILPFALIAAYAFFDDNGLTLDYIRQLCSRELLNVVVSSVNVAIQTTLLTLLLAYPAAYFLAKQGLSHSHEIVLLFLFPMMVNMLLNTFALLSVLRILHIPMGQGSLLIGMTYNFLPFMLQPIYNCLTKLDPHITEAAHDLGASPAKTFLHVIFPLSAPGIFSGISMVFMPTISTFAVSELLTLNKVRLYGSYIETNFDQGMIHYGAALSALLMVVLLINHFVTRK